MHQSLVIPLRQDGLSQLAPIDYSWLFHVDTKVNINPQVFILTPIPTKCSDWKFEHLSPIFLLISNLISELLSHQFLGTKTTETNNLLKTDANIAYYTLFRFKRYYFWVWPFYDYFWSCFRQLHSVAKVYAVLPFYDVKCLCSGGREWGREESHSH